MTHRVSLNPFATSPNTRTRWLPELGNTLRPSFQRLSNELRIPKTAREAGVDNFPSATDRDLDEPQRQVVAEIHAGSNLLKQFAENQLYDAEEKIRVRMPKKIEIGLSTARARAAVSEAKQTHAAELEERRLVERRRHRELRKWKRDNGISREARYADEWYLPAATLFALLVVESLANAFIFKEAGDLGLVGGFGLAMLFSVVTVSLGFCVGLLGLRFFFHIEPLFKIFGMAIATVCLTAGIGWNVLIAHFREALEKAPGASFVDPTLLTTPSMWFSLSTVEAWALLLLGLLILAAAAMKGHGGRGCFTDSYPGYRSVDLAYRESESIYAEEQDEYKSAVSNAYGDAWNALSDRYAKDEAAVAEIFEISDVAAQRIKEIGSSIGEWCEAGSALLRLYREENRAIRSTPAPLYFDIYPTFDEMKLGLRDAFAIRDLPARAADIHEANAKTLAEIGESIAEAREQEVKVFLSEIDAIERIVERKLATDWEELKDSPRPSPGGGGFQSGGEREAA
jgi:hypothetical protein